MSIYNRKKRIHFVGIGGAGMSSLAKILLDMGHKISGSDRQRTEITDYLRACGAHIFEGHAPEHVLNLDYVVYSSAIPQTNPELERARQLGIPCVRRAEMLGQIANRRTEVAVAGTHGKTSTCSMLAQTLVFAEKDPMIIAGGNLAKNQNMSRLGSGELVLVEADEYDRSFLTLFPRLAVLTSLEADHMDIYRNTEDLQNTFLNFTNQVAFDGALLVCNDFPLLRQMIPQIQRTVISYGLSEKADYRAENMRFAQSASVFDVYHGQNLLGRIELPAPGEHSVRNALGAIAAARELEIPFEKIRQSLSAYQGVSRRFEILGRAGNIMVVDDYAHHPTEIRATLQSARKGWPRRIVAVFQPHLYSRTRDLYREFAAALALADQALISDVYAAREKEIPGVNGELIAKAMSRKAAYIADKEQIISTLKKQVRPGDMVLFIGAGDITQYAHLFFKKLNEA